MQKNICISKPINELSYEQCRSILDQCRTRMEQIDSELLETISVTPEEYNMAIIMGEVYAVTHLRNAIKKINCQVGR